MFLSKEYHPSILKEASPKIVGCELSDKELQKFLNEIDVGFQIIDNSTRWAAFAQYYAYQYNFNKIKAASFAYMVSLFMTGIGISLSTEMYFKEAQIESDLEDKLNQIKSKYDDEKKQMIALFRNIFWTYKQHSSKYEYATERLSFKVTLSEMEKFQAIKGRNNKEKFKKLIGDKMYTVSDNIHSKDLVKLGFPKDLCTSSESCEILLEHCKKYDMKFLKGSYYTLVHKDFDKYFKVSKSNKIRELLTCKDLNENINLPLDHVNLFKSKIEDDVYILTSSPYDPSLNINLFNQIKSYPYSIYVIHPNFLDYAAFVDRDPVGALRNPLSNMNYAFTNASADQILNINQVIYGDLDTFVFEFLIDGSR